MCSRPRYRDAAASAVLVQMLVVPADLAVSASRVSVELSYRFLLAVPPIMNFGAGEVTDVPM